MWTSLRVSWGCSNEAVHDTAHRTAGSQSSLGISFSPPTFAPHSHSWGFPPSHLKLPHVPWFPLVLLWDLPGISTPITFQATYPGALAARSSWKAGFISYSDHSPGILRHQLPPPILKFPIKFMTSSSRTFYVQRSSAFVQLNFILTLTKLFLFDLSNYYNYRKELIRFCNCKT